MAIKNNPNPAQSEIDLYNDHGLYQWYGAYKNFIIYHNPKVWGMVESFRLKSIEPPNLSFVTPVEERVGVVKINRAGELKNNFYHPNKSFIDYRGLWDSDQINMYVATSGDNLKTCMEWFKPPLDFKHDDATMNLEIDQDLENTELAAEIVNMIHSFQ